MGYFKPLRRKLGVVTLVIACVFAGGWIRCQFLSEQLYLWVAKHSVVTVVSENLVLALSLWWWNEQDFVFPAKSIILQSDERLPWGTAYYAESLAWGFRCNSFDGGNGEVGCSIPYWSIVIPLTLLSAWLLLSKPRVRKQPCLTPEKI